MQSFKVAPLQKSTQVFQLLIIGVIPIIIIAVTAALPEVRSEWPITLPAGIVALVILGGLMFFTRRRRIELHEHELIVASTLYTRKLPRSQIALDAARIVNLEEHPEYKPALKTNGYAVPGFKSGYFRSRKWKKMFCLITKPKVLILPLLDSEQVIVISPEQPQQLLKALNSS